MNARQDSKDFEAAWNDAAVQAAQRACAAWWASFGGSADPEGEWEGLDETERHYWQTIAEAALDGR